LQLLTAESGTELPTSALQRFRPESEGQLTCPERGREDRS
jgi:hypothetical protein